VDLPNLPGGPGGNFMEQFLADLLRMMGSGMGGSGAKLDMARAMAQGVASGGATEANVDPRDRMAIEPLVAVAELHVAEITSLPTGQPAPLEVQAVQPGSWAWQTVDDWVFVLDAAGASVAGPALTVEPTELAGDETDVGSGMVEFLTRAMATMGPVLAAMQLGAAVGHLARSTMGQYELPVPRPDRHRHRLLVVPANLDKFASDWSLPTEDVRLWVCLRDVTVHTVLGRPSVAQRFRDLLTAVATAGARATAGALSNLEHVDLTDPEALQRLLGNPEEILGAAPSADRERAVDELAAATAALLGYVEHVLDQAATRLLGGRGPLGEAWRRWQVERDTTDRAAEVLLGLDVGPATVDRGVQFIQGVVERAGPDVLGRLWSDGAALPTPAEIEAPGLWLARTSLPDFGSST
jgi:putative hydrolase